MKVEWPEGIKDANECLVKLGPAALLNAYENAVAWPITGVISPRSYVDKVRHLYRHGLPGGRPMGWKLDRYYRPLEGTLTVVSGTPHSGTSAWLNNVAVRLALNHGWKFAVFSPEYQPYELMISDITSVALSKPFGDGVRPRMTEKEMEDTQVWVDEHFIIVDPKPRTPENILDTVARSVGLAVVVALFAPLGDLAESLIKRDLGVKDMGGILPGHGGVMDRIDSVLFVAPAAFIYLRLILL